MLKKCYGLVLGLVVLTGSACVTPTHASSASIVITNIRAGSQASAAEEAVLLYNNSSFEVDITNWCLANKAFVKFACFAPSSQYEASIIPAYSYASVASMKSINSTNQTHYSVVYEPVSASSGSIIASSDTISLLDASSQVIDQFSWSSSISSAQQWARAKLSALPDLFVDTNAAIDWTKVAYVEFPVTQLEYREIPTEQPIEPPAEEVPETPIAQLPPIITELLPNAVGSDTGNEFVEVHNPNGESNISLAGYKLAVGPQFEKAYTLPNYLLEAGEYKIFTNAELGYSLLNSSSRVSLSTPDQILTSESPVYDMPKEGESWALIDGMWQYTNQPTPNAQNMSSTHDFSDEEELIASTAAPKPCADNQYRSAQTNRCRLIVSATSAAPALCKAGQERNPETNRCRNIPVASTAICKQGQERNPETNRCRTIKQLAATDYGVKGVTSQQQSGLGWYMWAAIAGVVLLIVGYAVWEWRDELKKLIEYIKLRFARNAN